MSPLLLKQKNNLETLCNKLRQKCSDDKKEWKCRFASETGIILPFLKWLFDRILYRWMSLSYWTIAHRYDKKAKEKQNKPTWENLWKQRYRCVDCYVISWFALGVCFFMILLANRDIGQCCIFRCTVASVLSYRLFDIFQAWVNIFLLKEDPQLRSPLRTLILALIGYVEIVVAYAVIAFLFKSGFQEVSNMGTFYCIAESLRYSVGVLTTLGSSWEPSACNGYSIFYTQILLGVLFVVVVIQRVIALMHERRR